MNAGITTHGKHRSFTPALSILGHWFLRRRALALGCAGSGASVGGIVFPIMFEHLIDKIGFRWAVRATAFTALACLCVACALMKTRLPPSKNIKASNIIDLHGFRDLQYSLAAVGAFLYVLKRLDTQFKLNHCLQIFLRTVHPVLLYPSICEFPQRRPESFTIPFGSDECSGNSFSYPSWLGRRSDRNVSLFHTLCVAICSEPSS